jgi:hypothetical protein
MVTIVLIGDVNGDAKINAIDEKIINDYIKGMTIVEAFMLASDINNDYAVNAIDIKLITDAIRGDYVIHDPSITSTLIEEE